MSSQTATPIDALLRRATRGMHLGLSPTLDALARLGHPHRDLKVVHVAGTNGKGSVCAMVEAVARAAGLRTGLYTSPHLCRIAERIRVDGEPIDGTSLNECLEQALGAAEDLTFFETLTVAAFVALRRARVDVAILEVGLGGRLDATNVVAAPLCAAVTSVGVDHTELLGGTLARIAREKAGIAKQGVPIVLGALQPEAHEAVLCVAQERGAGPIVVADTPWPGRVGLPGEHQRKNAAVAAAVVDVLSARWPELRASLARGLSSVRWPGRLETLALDETVEVVLDGAHNMEGADALACALGASDASPDRTVLLFGAMADKPFLQMLARLAPFAARRVYTTPRGRAPAPIEQLTTVAPGEAVGVAAAAIERAVALARQLGAGDRADASRARTTRADASRARTTRADEGRARTTRADASRARTTRADEGRARTTRADEGRARTTRAGEGRARTTRARVVVTGSLYLVGELRARLLGLDCDPFVSL